MDWYGQVTSGRRLVSDGAMGTMLQSLGLEPGQCPEWWNLRHPERVQAVHRAYLEAGANLLTTNTFGGNRLRLAAHGLEANLREVNRRGVELAREVAGERAAVMASVGPTGALMEPFGDLSEEQAFEVFSEQIEALRQGGADTVILETFMALEEIVAALRAAKAQGMRVIASMSFGAGERTMMGVTPEQAATTLVAEGALVVGANCSTGAQEMVPVIQRMRAVVSVPLIAQPNAGMPTLIEGKAVYTQKPEEMAAFVPQFVQAGANIVGSCCGSTPDFTRAIAQALASLS
ncbi:MAG: homocysteine S-methyltransferase family protein [Armatimonadota bacterium]|nr:homocysteine S-methyltransferase family protein [bacterium]MDW8105786.1 homocysteine S-methyltransferase family protein [Armatimonadota bacterium]MDW8291310.1 homocysteine S-methyltransferase family protein [Armatimonadota bacterium]